MINRRVFLGGVAVFGVTGCAGPNAASDNWAFQLGILPDKLAPGRDARLEDLPPFFIRNVNADAPRMLTSTEENRFKPRADIIWREEPFDGDRHSQVAKIVHEAGHMAVIGLEGDLELTLDIEILRFHALTQITRYTVGGSHSVELLLRLSNTATGELVVPAWAISTELPAYGGQKAVEAEIAGLTQRSRIRQHLASLIRHELDGGKTPIDMVEFRR